MGEFYYSGCCSLLYNVSLNPTVICWSSTGRNHLISWIIWFLDNLNSFTLVESQELKPPDSQKDLLPALVTHFINTSLLHSSLSTWPCWAPSVVWFRQTSLQSGQVGRAWRVNEWKRRASIASSQGAQFEKITGQLTMENLILSDDPCSIPCGKSLRAQCPKVYKTLVRGATESYTRHWRKFTNLLFHLSLLFVLFKRGK